MWCGEVLGLRSIFVRVAVLVGGLLVTEGALAQELPAHGPSPAPKARETCPLLFGPRFGAFGPNSWVAVAGVVQPGVCSLELSVGFGFGRGAFSGYDEYVYDDGADVYDFSADATYVSFTVPLGARFWFMSRHSLLADAGFGFTRYLMSADVAAPFETDEEWTRLTTPLVAYLGIGYGYRVEGAEPGPRIAFVLGAFAHLTELGESTMLGRFHPSEVEGLRQDMDAESDELTDLEPYAEVSVSWMF
jgi:hypothetical protein